MEAAKLLPGDVDVESQQAFQDSEEEEPENLEIREDRDLVSWVLMAVRRRNGGPTAKNDFERVPFLDEKREKTDRRDLKSRRRVKIVLGASLLLFSFL